MKKRLLQLARPPSGALRQLAAAPTLPSLSLRDVILASCQCFAVTCQAKLLLKPVGRRVKASFATRKKAFLPLVLKTKLLLLPRALLARRTVTSCLSESPSCGPFLVASLSFAWTKRRPERRWNSTDRSDLLPGVSAAREGSTTPPPPPPPLHPNQIQ